MRDTVALAADGHVEISDTHTGSITVTTWERPQVAYEATLTPSGADSVLISTLSVDHSEQQFSLDHDGTSWTLKIPGLVTISPGGGKNPAGHYRLTIPKTADLEIDDYASSIDVSDVQADVEIDTHRGTASVDSVDGFLEVDTHEGTIEVAALRGGVTIDTYDGEVSVSFDRFSEASSAEAHSGTLRFSLPANAGFTLQTDFTSTELTIDEAFGIPSKNEERRIFNGGGPELSLDAFSGTIELRALRTRDR